MADDGCHWIGTARSGYLDTQVGSREVNGTVRGDEKPPSGNLYSICLELRGLQTKTGYNPFELPFPRPLVFLFFHGYPIQTFQLSLLDLDGVSTVEVVIVDNLICPGTGMQPIIEKGENLSKIVS